MTERPKIRELQKKRERRPREAIQETMETVRSRLATALSDIGTPPPAGSRKKTREEWQKPIVQTIKMLLANLERLDDSGLRDLVALVQGNPDIFNKAYLGMEEDFYYYDIEDDALRAKIIGIMEEAGYRNIPEYQKRKMADIPLSEERRQLTTLQGKEALPDSLKRIGGAVTFYEAMGDDDTFAGVMRELDNLEREFSPVLFTEVLLVMAETSYEVYSFLRRYGATQWRQAISNPSYFQDFMRGYLIAPVKASLPPRLLDEMLMVAASANAENAKWFMDKAARDEEGGTMLEEPAYYLRDIMSPNAFSTLIARVKGVIGESGQIEPR